VETKKNFIIAPKIHESKISVFAVLSDNLKLVSTYENSNETTVQMKYFGVVMPSGLGQSKSGGDSWNSLLVFLVKRDSQAHVKIMRFWANGDDYNTANYQLETLVSSEFSGLDYDEMFVDEDRKLIFLFKNNSTVFETLEYKDGNLTRRQQVDCKNSVQNIVAFTKWTEKLYCVLSLDYSKSLTALVFSMDGKDVKSVVNKPNDLGANPVIIPLGRYDYPFLLINSTSKKMMLLGKNSADKDKELKIDFNPLETLKLPIPKGLDLNTITPFEHGAILYGEGSVEKMKMFEIVLDL